MKTRRTSLFLKKISINSVIKTAFIFKVTVSIEFFLLCSCYSYLDLHPTQKPLELMKYLISTYSNENDMVLDNTMGSGTTCLAAKELNRKFIGIEKEPKYYEIACQRCGF